MWRQQQQMRIKNFYSFYTLFFAFPKTKVKQALFILLSAIFVLPSLTLAFKIIAFFLQFYLVFDAKRWWQHVK